MKLTSHRRNKAKRTTDPFNLFEGQIAPRIGLIAFHKIAISSLIISILLGAFIDHFPVANTQISTLSNIGFTFSSLSLGACFATAALCLSLPGEGRLSKWAKTPGEIEGSSALSDLIFVIVWAAVCQIFLVLVCTLALILGGTYTVFPDSAGLLQRILISFSAFTFFYSLGELLIVISTVSQLGIVITHEENTG